MNKNLSRLQYRYIILNRYTQGLFLYYTYLNIFLIYDYHYSNIILT